MGPFHLAVSRALRGKYKDKGLVICDTPRYIARSRWTPAFCMRLDGDSRVVAVDIVPSANVPKTIYREEIQRLRQKHHRLRVIVCALASNLDLRPETKTFCQEMGCGLQAFIPQVGLQTVITTDLDGAAEVETPIEPGWFPQRILEKVTGLTRLSFHDTIDDFCRDVVPLGEDENAVTALVQTTVDELLQHYPKGHPSIRTFMKLARFESILRKSKPTASDHVLHSFRVFLAGCAVINRFYDGFLKAHKRFCVGSNTEKLSIEYCWLLTAVFHDIGRPLEAWPALLEEELDDEDLAVSVVGKETRWLKPKYADARRMLTSLGLFVAGSPDDDDEWDAGAITDDQAVALSTEWTDLYDGMTSHAVISAFDMLASVIEQARAVNARKNWPFIITHATPAALAILLHDYRIWDAVGKWKLHPVDGTLNPMAALLIFIDTWDDFRRRGARSPISVEAFDVDDGGVKVTIKWMKTEAYEKERVKYGAFKRAVKKRQFKMDIRVRTATA